MGNHKKIFKENILKDEEWVQCWGISKRGLDQERSRRQIYCSFICSFYSLVSIDFPKMLPLSGFYEVIFCYVKRNREILNIRKLFFFSFEIDPWGGKIMGKCSWKYDLGSLSPVLYKTKFSPLWKLIVFC